MVGKFIINCVTTASTLVSFAQQRLYP